MAEKPNYTVLLVDDDNFLLQMYSMKFTSEGFTVHTATSVNDAIEILRNGLTPDAVAFDITMPEHDGFFLLETVKAEGLAKNSKLIALTNQQSEAEKNKALELGATDYLIKATMIPSEVVNTVRAAISNHQAS
jgi:DNA-binding response OmpR family regulator